jgi:hypothetical protein
MKVGTAHGGEFTVMAAPILTNAISGRCHSTDPRAPGGAGGGSGTAGIGGPMKCSSMA